MNSAIENPALFILRTSNRNGGSTDVWYMLPKLFRLYLTIFLCSLQGHVFRWAEDGLIHRCWIYIHGIHSILKGFQLGTLKRIGRKAKRPQGALYEENKWWDDGRPFLLKRFLSHRLILGAHLPELMPKESDRVKDSLVLYVTTVCTNPNHPYVLMAA